MSGIPSVQDQEGHIRDAASRRGIDPDTAVAVARTEGLSRGVWQSNSYRGKNREPSYGAFQLLSGGKKTGFPIGLGNDFKKATGLDPKNPANWRSMIDFALDSVARTGSWGAFYGAARAGISKTAGLANAKAIGIAPQMAALPDSVAVPPAAMRANPAVLSAYMDTSRMRDAMAAPAPTSILSGLGGLFTSAANAAPAPAAMSNLGRQQVARMTAVPATKAGIPGLSRGPQIGGFFAPPSAGKLAQQYGAYRPGTVAPAAPIAERFGYTPAQEKTTARTGGRLASVVNQKNYAPMTSKPATAAGVRGLAQFAPNRTKDDLTAAAKTVAKTASRPTAKQIEQYSAYRSTNPNGLTPAQQAVAERTRMEQLSMPAAPTLNEQRKSLGLMTTPAAVAAPAPAKTAPARPSMPTTPATSKLAAQYAQYRTPTTYQNVRTALQAVPAAVAPPAQVLAPRVSVPAMPIAPPVREPIPERFARFAPAPPSKPSLTPGDIYGGAIGQALDNTGKNTVSNNGLGVTGVTNQYGASTGMKGGYQTAISGPLGTPGIQTAAPSAGFSMGPTAKGALKGGFTGAISGGPIGLGVGALLGGLLGREMSKPNAGLVGGLGRAIGLGQIGGRGFPDAPTGGRAAGALSGKQSNRGEAGMRGISDRAAGDIAAGRQGLF